MKKRILIVEDEAMIAHDIKEHLDESEFDVAGIAYNGKSAKHQLSQLEVDVAILDIRLKGDINGVQVAEYINAHVHIPFIFLTSHSDKETLDQAKQTRPGGYLLKPIDKASIITALEVAMFNFKTPEFPLIETINQQLPTPLSEREYQLLAQLKKGGSNQAIATILGITLNTVKSHLYHAFTKLDASNRMDALYRLEQLAQGRGPLGKGK